MQKAIVPGLKHTHVRYGILAVIFAASCLSYGDRISLALAGPGMARDVSLGVVKIGYLFSAFSWAYVLGQVPAGGLLDRFGPRGVYGASIAIFSLLALFVGFSGLLSAGAAFAAILALRFLSGLAQSPIFPGNGRVVAAWFPTAERGRASAIFNASQYFALVVFAPLLGWISHAAGWKSCFWFIGLFGFVLALLWTRNVYDPRRHPRISASEIETIEGGGGLVLAAGRAPGAAAALTWRAVKALLRHRMLAGIYLGQYCVNTLTWFFLTWFPIYLSRARGLSVLKAGFAAALPAVCGGIGGVLGGVISDRLLRAGYSLSFARKAPIVAGMLLSVVMIGCIFARSQTVMLLLMSLSFFGKGIGSLGWTLIADTSPTGMVGVNGALFNLIGNISGVTTPVIIAYLVKTTGSFNDALLFVGATALLAIAGYVPIAGTIRRLELKPAPIAEGAL